MSSNFLVIISREFVFSILWKHITINTNATTPRFMAPKSLFTHSINCYKSCCGSLAARSFQSERLNWTVTIDKRFSNARRRLLGNAMGMKSEDCLKLYLHRLKSDNLQCNGETMGRQKNCLINCDNRQEIFRSETPLTGQWMQWVHCKCFVC